MSNLESEIGTAKVEGNVFKEAVLASAEIQSGYRPGLQALGRGASCIHPADSRKCSGSVDIDSTVKMLYPTAPRWDYAVGYEDKAYFVEVHPAGTSNVDEVLKKAAWLRRWLDEKALPLKSIAADKVLYWVPSGANSILRHAPQYRRIAQCNIRIVSPLQLPVE